MSVAAGRGARWLALWLGIWLASSISGCADGAEKTLVALEPAPFTRDACAVCGMLVAEQTAPRGQILHRDGQRRFTCSIGDLRAYLQTPSPLGKPLAVYVEALPEGAGSDKALGPLPWIPAEDAFYVVGLRRGGVMGMPVMSFSDADDARSALGLKNARPATWAELLESPFYELPGDRQP